MKTTTAPYKFSLSFYVITAFVIVALALATFPLFASAATYGFVNHSGFVSTISAATPMSAMTTAASISPYSGVILIQTQADAEIIGDRVFGV